MVAARENLDYLPGIAPPPELEIASTVAAAEVIFLACPSHALAAMALSLERAVEAARPHLIVSLAKGLEPDTYMFRCGGRAASTARSRLRAIAASACDGHARKDHLGGGDGGRDFQFGRERDSGEVVKVLARRHHGPGVLAAPGGLKTTS